MITSLLKMNSSLLSLGDRWCRRLLGGFSLLQSEHRDHHSLHFHFFPSTWHPHFFTANLLQASSHSVPSWIISQKYTINTSCSMMYSFKIALFHASWMFNNADVHVHKQIIHLILKNNSSFTCLMLVLRKFHNHATLR